jgi:UDP-GlcNAc3NAcA epimerase
VSARPRQGATGPVKLALVVGARPQFIKLAPVCRAITAANSAGQQIQGLIIHTGQHYDPSMSDIFFEELHIPRADVHLGVGSGPHGQQTGRMLEKLEITFTEHKPDLVLTFGDTNSTLAATLAAVKLHVPVAHVESGLRSFKRQMPEEVNRIVADHLSDLLFSPTPEALRNLEREGLAARAVPVGDVMLDAIQFNKGLAIEKSQILDQLGLVEDRYLLATVHRAENTDTDRLGALLDTFVKIASADRPLVFPVHPRTAKRIRDMYSDRTQALGLRLLEPVGYLDMIRLAGAARMVLTDSGGLQKEAFFLGRPCVTLRDETEWVETVTEGGNLLAGSDSRAILDAVSKWDQVLAQGSLDLSDATSRVFGNGRAAVNVVAASMKFLE